MKEIRFWNKISVRLFIYSVFITISISAVYLFISSQYINDLMKFNISDRSVLIMDEAKHHMNSELLKEVRDFFLMAQSDHEVYEILEINYQDIFQERIVLENHFIKFMENSSNLKSLNFIDFRGNELVKIENRKRVRNYSKIDGGNNLFNIYNKVKETEPGKISYLGPYVNNNTIDYYAGIGIVDPNMGEIGGIIILTFDIDHYIKDLERYTLFGDQVLWLIADDNTILKEADNKIFSPNPLHSSQDIYLLSANKVLSRDNEFNFFNIYISISNKFFQNRTNELIKKSVLFTIIILVIMTISIFLLSIQFSSPIKDLTNTAIEIVNGNLDTKIDTKSKSEIGILAKNFKIMTNHLIDINKNLERKVEERTIELQKYSRELEIRNEEVKNFSYIVSHDLKSPLVSINGFSCEISYAIDEMNKIIDKKEYLDKKDIDSINELIKEDFNESIIFIKDAVERMDKLVSLVLKYSRLGRKEVNIEEVDINKIIEKITNSLNYQIKDSNAKINRSNLPVIRADLNSIELIFGNLIDNALKYLVKERPGVISIVCNEKKDNYEFIIEDNGSGIDSKNKDKIFEIFRRGRQINVQGEGMGLAYVKTLIKKHRGNISCESELDKGSKFIFTIPRSL